MVQEYKVLVYEDRTVWKNMDGEEHRIDGPAIERSDGTKSWWINGQRHRIDGPAVECSDGTKSWWVNDQLHRIDGPAVEFSNGYKEWWIEGQELTEDEFNRKVNPVKELTVNEISKLLGYEVKIVKS